MIKKRALFFLVGILWVSCNNEPSATSSGKQPEVQIHEIDELKLTLPVNYKNVNAVQDLRTLLEKSGGKVTAADPGLLEVMVNEMERDRWYFYDTESDKNLNYLYFDRVGPRFPLEENLISKYIEMFENQCKAQYQGRNYTIEKLDQKIMNVSGNEILKFRHKHTLDKLEWFTNYYLIQMQSNRRTLVVISYDYNGGQLDLEKYITSIN